MMNYNAILDQDMDVVWIATRSSDINHVPITFFPLSFNLIAL